MPQLPWEALFEVSPVPMSVIDVHGRQVAANAAYAAFLGYTTSQLADVDVGRITRPGDAAWTRNYLMRLVSGEIETLKTDKWYVKSDGEEVLARLSARRIVESDGTCRYLVATIAPSAESPASIDDSLARRLLAFTGETVTLVDRSGEIRFTKGELTEVAGYPTTYWRGRKLGDQFDDGVLEALLAEHADFIGTPGAVVETEVQLRGGDGTPMLSMIRAMNCLDDPILDGFVVVSRDVTDEREAVAELLRRGETAEAVADAQTRLLATVSHELRNPLHAVRGLAELLASEALPPKAADLAAGIVRQLAGLSHVTQDLLDAARLDAGGVTMQPAPTDLEQLVRDVIDLGRSAAGSKSLSITSRVAQGVPGWVFADGDRLRQVLSNLVGNAVKFTETGSVQLIVRTDGSDRVVFSVVDTGAGIPAAEHAAVLEPFTVGSTAGAERGAGLGLSIVKRIVTAMNGRLSLTSTVGTGTRFDVVVSLPAAAPPAHLEQAVLAPGLRVLVVEDNPVNQQLARSQLERLGLEPVIVDRGEDGLAALTADEDLRFDVVLMDQQLPGWSGTETTRRIRELGGSFSDLPIIGLSASASKADRSAFIEAGMNDFVAKPASIDDLSTAISAAIAARASTASSDEAQPDSGESVAADAASDAEILDTATLTQLGDELGSMDIVHDLLDTFLSELDDRVAAIMGDGETESRRAAHTLKSSARLLGAMQLADRCAAIELDGDTTDGIDQLAARTRAACESWPATSEPATNTTNERGGSA